MTQQTLFYEDAQQALRLVVELGKGYKATASHLWPEMKLDSAYAKLKHALDGSGKERELTLSQAIAAMRFNGRCDALLFACDELSMSRPDPITTQSVLERSITEAAQYLAGVPKLAATLERLQERLERNSR